VASPPLVRFALVQLGAQEHRLIITNHHLLMDGWSAPLLVRDLLTLYEHAGNVAALPRTTPYRDYLALVAAADRAAAIAAWGEALAGVESATLIADGPARSAPIPPEQATVSLEPSLTAALVQQARATGLTLNTLVQTAWGILLGRLTGREDVV